MATTTFKASGETVIPRAAKDGANGEKGDSGLTITFSKASLQLAYDGSDGSGLTGTGSGNSTTLKVVENGTDVTSKVANITVSETKNCYVSRSGTSFYISSLPWQKVAYGSTSMSVPYDSGYFVVSFTYDGSTYTATCTFSVDIVAVLGKQTLMSGALETEQGELRQTISQVEVNAKSVSISVSEKAVSRRNMLAGSAARKFGEGWGYMSGGSYIYSLPCEQILKNGGIDGVNCLRCRSQKTSSTAYTYSGFRWNGQSQQGNIKVEKGKTYTVSFWGKTSSPSTVSFVCETIYQGAQTDTSRPAGYSGPSGTTRSFTASTADSWTLFSAQIEVPSGASYEYLEVNIFVKQDSYSVGEAYICRPMMEEGEYMGWSRSELDYDYQGGNLLDNARTLAVGGNLSHVGSSTVTAEGFDGDCSVAHVGNSSGTSDKELLCWKATTDGFTFRQGQDYTLSFLAKGSGNINIFVYCSSNNTAKVFAETSLGVVSSANNGASAFALSSEWKRYWVHVRPISSSPLPTDVLFRALAGCDAYISQPKLEEGATMTDWTERKTDLIDKASLKAAGVSVASDSVTLYGDQVHVKATKSSATDTLLIDNTTGKVAAGLIDAEEIMTRQLKATNLTVTDNSKLGPFDINDTGLSFTTTTSSKSLSYNVYEDRFVFVDNKNKMTLYGGFDSINGVVVSLGSASNGQADLKNGDKGVGLYCAKDGVTGNFTYNYFGVVYNSLGVYCEYSDNTATLIAGSLTKGLWISVPRSGDVAAQFKGLPTSSSGLSTGMLYVENGFLKVKT